MTLKIYVPKDGKGRDWAPDTPHEVGACEWMLKKAWAVFHHLDELYVILLNLQYPHPPIDMLVLQERGLGILEMKHHPGPIQVRWDGPWTYGDARHEIRSGSDHSHLNPREQVRDYAITFRSQSLYELLPPPVRDDQSHWNEYQFQTAVCFTNHLAVLGQARDLVERQQPHLEPWEAKFSLLDLDGFTTWVRELRFGSMQTPPYDPLRLAPAHIKQFATQTLGMVEWAEIYPAMLTGHPYGGLVLEDEVGRQVFHLLRDQTLIGRSHKCEVTLPERYSRVSKEHCVIEWTPQGICLIDRPSRHGTYVRGRRVDPKSPVSLQDGDVIRLGGESQDSRTCTLKLELYDSGQTRATDPGSGFA